MRKITALICTLVICACGRWGNDYQPKLSATPNDQVKYEKDRKECISSANEKMKKLSQSNNLKSSVAGGVPLLGIAMVGVEQSDPNHIDNTPMGIADRCLAKKGYNVIIEKHCC